MDKQKIAQALFDVLNLKGIEFIFQGRVIKKDKFLVSEDIVDTHLLIFMIARMLKNGEIELNFTHKATDKNKNYIKKLLEEE